MATDRRTPKRIRVKWPVLIITNKGYSIAETRDISSEGAFIRCKLPLNPKERLRLFIMAPNKRPFEVPAEVAWSNPKRTDIDAASRGMGVRFVQVPGHHRKLLRNIVADHLKRKVDFFPEEK